MKVDTYHQRTTTSTINDEVIDKIRKLKEEHNLSSDSITISIMLDCMDREKFAEIRSVTNLSLERSIIRIDRYILNEVNKLKGLANMPSIGQTLNAIHDCIDIEKFKKISVLITKYK